MLPTVQGVYHDGKIVLLESPPGVSNARVIVTFLPPDGPIDLRARGIGESQAAELRARFRTVADDWDRPEMDAYDAL